MKRCIGGRLGYYLIAAVLALGVWAWLAHVYPPLIAPSVSSVFRRLADLLSREQSWLTIWLTVQRLAAGLALGVSAGTLIGLAMGYCRPIGEIFRPLLGLVQAVPPVSWLVLALLWFGFDGRPSVFIVALSALPVVIVNLVEGIRGVDVKLLQMGRIYGFSRLKRLRYIVVPSILPSFRAGLRIAIGLGCKGVVMGEVLTTSTGVGGAITTARQNLEPDAIVAWTLIMVVLYYLLDGLAGLSLRGGKGRPC